MTASQKKGMSVFVGTIGECRAQVHQLGAAYDVLARPPFSPDTQYVLAENPYTGEGTSEEQQYLVCDPDPAKNGTLTDLDGFIYHVQQVNGQGIVLVKSQPMTP